jgi:hypothetical protein
MSGVGWVGDLIAERQRQTETARLETERELLRFNKFRSLSPIIWNEIEGRVRASIDDFNRGISTAENRLNIKAPSSWSMLIYSNSRELQAFMITLNLDSGTLSYGHPTDARTQRALTVKIDHESHWSLEDSVTHADVPIGSVDRVLLIDFLKSMPVG